MIKGDLSDNGSPPKQRLEVQKICSQIKGDKNAPDSGGDLSPAELLEDQSYEQIQIELFEDDEDAVAKASDENGVNDGKKNNQISLIRVQGSAENNKSASIGARKSGTTAADVVTERKTMVIDEASVREIERNGYPKSYIMASLNNDDLNHVTTYYYILQTQKEY